MIKVLVRSCLKWGMRTAASAVILFAVLISGIRLMVPLLNHQRKFFERWATHVLHQPVRISQIATSWYGFNPTLTLQKVIITDPNQQKSLLCINQLTISFNLFQSLIHCRLFPSHLLLSGACFNVYEDKSGTLNVDGMVSQKQHSFAELGDMKKVFLRLFTQSNIILKNIDIHYYMVDGQLIHLTNLRLKVTNGILHHQMSGVGSLLQTVPTQFRFLLVGSSENAELYVGIKNFVFSRWAGSYYLQKYFKKFCLSEGLGNLQLWAKFKNNKLQSVQGLLNSSRIRIQNSESHAPLFIDPVSANLYWQRYTDGWGVMADHTNFRMNGKQWPEHTFGFRIVHFHSGPLLLLKSDYLNLSDLHELAYQIRYESKRMQTLFEKFKPHGVLKNFTLLYELQKPTLSYHLITDFANLSFQPQEDLPGGLHLTGFMDINPRGGKLTLRSSNSVIALPSFFHSPFKLNRLQLAMIWQHRAVGSYFHVLQSNIQDDNLHWKGEGSLVLPTQGSPFINLQGKFDLKSTNAVKTYLPSHGLTPHLQAWLTQAFSEGKIRAGTVSFKGPLDRFPFINEEGSFDAVAEIEHVILHYQLGWPVFQNIKAKVVFHNNQLHIIADHANTLGNPLDHVKVAIPNLKDPILTVTSHSASNLGDGFKFLKATPLSLAKRIRNNASRGAMNLNLKLTIPLGHQKQNVIADGQLTIKNGQFSLKNWGITLDHINGHFHFVNQNFSAAHVFAKWLGLHMMFHIVTLNLTGQSPVLQLEMSGQLSMSTLRKKFKLPILNNLKGSTTYRALLNLHGKNSKSGNLNIATNLTGIQSTLPSPYNKLSQAPALLTSHFSFSNDKLSKIEMHYHSDPAGATTSLLMTPVNTGWTINIQNRSAAGNLLIPNRPAYCWRGHFSRLYLPELKKEKKQWSPQTFPPLDLTVDDFHYGKKVLGKLALQTSRTAGGLRINRLAVTASLFDIDATGVWRQVRRGKSQTMLLGSFTSPNLGELLKQSKITHALKGGAGCAGFFVKWPGSPAQFNAAQLNGHIKLNVHDGRITELTNSTESELGFGRLINLFSLQSLPKLPLNLVNLSKKGFAFNFFKGHFLLLKGVAKTQNASLVGDVAWVQIKGLIGFANKNYDLHLQVVPNITSTLPLIVGLAGGPLAGVITWMVDKILAPHVGKAAQVHYHIAGSWKKPNITLPAPW